MGRDHLNSAGPPNQTDRGKGVTGSDLPDIKHGLDVAAKILGFSGPQVAIAPNGALNVAELVRTEMKAFPEVYKNTEKILLKANPQQQGQAQQQLALQQGGGGGENTGAVPNMQRTPPTPTTIQEEVFGEQRGGI